MLSFKDFWLLVLALPAVGSGQEGLSTSSIKIGLDRQRVIANADNHALRELAASQGDLGVMLQATWELHQRTRPGNGIALTEELERVLGVTLPERFRTTLIVQNSARRDDLRDLPRHIVTVNDDATILHPPKYKREPLGLISDSASVESIEVRHQLLFVNQKGQFAKVGRRQIEFLQQAYPQFDKCAISVVGEKCVAAMYSSDGQAFPILSFDAKSGKQLWSSVAWGLGSEHLPVTGVRDIHVEIKVANGMVYVLGGDGSVFIDAFDLNSGAVRFHFATNYWFAAEGRGG